MSDKKQTAVEMLMEKLTYDNGFGQRWTSFTECTDLSSFFEEAKQMERERIEDAYEIAFSSACDYSRHDIEPKYEGASEYYDQTYGKATH
jgi:hypothetical protein